MNQPISLYIHWPFCLSKCPYCDFNSHVRNLINPQQWEKSLVRELKRYAYLTPGRRLVSIFFGGGTPSLMRPQGVADLITAAKQVWTPDPNLEITLEANPNSVEQERFQGFKEAGVNRISIGVQSLRPEALKKLGRQHSVAEAIKAIEIAQNTFQRVSFDLIYARPEQSLADWQDEISEALQFKTTHLSLYQLTIEPGTAFAPLHARGELIIPDEDLAADFYELTQDRLNAAGLPAYEISNHAALDHECRHNQVYWDYQDYIGIGPGAHGRLTQGDHKYATRQYKLPETWLKQVETTGSGDQEHLEIDPETQFTEAFMMGLRQDAPFQLDRFPQHAHNLLNQRRFEVLAQAGLITYNTKTLSTTAAGRQRLNAVLKSLLV